MWAILRHRSEGLLTSASPTIPPYPLCTPRKSAPGLTRTREYRPHPARRLVSPSTPIRLDLLPYRDGVPCTAVVTTRRAFALCDPVGPHPPLLPARLSKASSPMSPGSCQSASCHRDARNSTETRRTCSRQEDPLDRCSPGPS